MTRSMTGYGQARWEGDGQAVLVELRSVNGRFFKFVPHLPNEFAPIERDLEKVIRRRVKRGTVDLHVKLELAGARAARPINQDALASYLAQLRRAGEACGVDVTITAEALAALPGVLEADVISDEEAAVVHQNVLRTTEAAVDALDRMRHVEGANLREELLRHAEGLEAILAEVEARHPEAQGRYAERLTDRVNRLLQGTDIVVSQQDVAREIAIYAERSSVTEEIARLRSHVHQLRQGLDRNEPVGRRLEFLAQEMHREANTMGSKVADVGLSELIVDLHGQVGRIREQVANIE